MKLDVFVYLIFHALLVFVFFCLTMANRPFHSCWYVFCTSRFLFIFSLHLHYVHFTFLLLPHCYIKKQKSIIFSFGLSGRALCDSLRYMISAKYDFWIFVDVVHPSCRMFSDCVVEDCVILIIAELCKSNSFESWWKECMCTLLLSDYSYRYFGSSKASFVQ